MKYCIFSSQSAVIMGSLWSPSQGLNEGLRKDCGTGTKQQETYVFLLPGLARSARPRVRKDGTPPHCTANPWYKSRFFQCWPLVPAGCLGRWIETLGNLFNISHSPEFIWKLEWRWLLDGSKIEYNQCSCAKCAMMDKSKYQQLIAGQLQRWLQQLAAISLVIICKSLLFSVLSLFILIYLSAEDALRLGQDSETYILAQLIYLATHWHGRKRPLKCIC